MATHVVSTRLAPGDHRLLRELAERRGQSLAAAAAERLAAALRSPDDPGPADGPLVDAVRAELADVTNPLAVMHREVAVRMARTIERGEPGHITAVEHLRKAVNSCRNAERSTDDPAMGGMGGFLSLLGG